MLFLVGRLHVTALKETNFYCIALIKNFKDATFDTDSNRFLFYSHFKKHADENSWKIGRDIARLEAALSVCFLFKK
jgi:hypothetical protein